MPENKKTKKPIEQYEHNDKKRAYNPPVGLVSHETDKDKGKKTYAYDPHLDPQLQWAGKAEHTSFEVPTVSLHVHERIDPRTIIEAVKKKNGGHEQPSLFESPGENPPLREAIEFYKHKHNWSNRLIAGDSLLVMNSLLEKEGMAGKVQMIYIDPPYGVKYGSNFQPFVNKRDVKDGKDEDLTSEPETIKAFRDTWELGTHSYLSYLRDRLLLARELVTESGSIFVQISDENVHLLRNLMDEIFGVENFVSLITVQKAPYATSTTLPTVSDFLVWYAKDKSKIKYRQLFKPKEEISSFGLYRLALSSDGKTYRTLTKKEIETGVLPEGWRRFRLVSLVSQGPTSNPEPFEFKGRSYLPPANSHWKVKPVKLSNVAAAHRIQQTANSIQFRSFIDDFPISITHNLWTDTITGSFMEDKLYIVQTNPKIVQRCLLMTTDPGDIVFDPTCGSGTTPFVAEKWGRRWITCDTSRVAIALAKQRLATAVFDYYKLAYPEQGVGSGFKYKTVPHITLKSIANNEPPGQETLYDQPLKDNSKARITGPFTVEAVPSPTVKPIDDIDDVPSNDETVLRTGETLRQDEWRSELLKTGIRGKNGQYIHFSRVEPLPGTRWLHADAETKPNNEGAAHVRETLPERAMISFGPEHMPLEQRQVGLAIEEALTLVPKPKIIVFAAFQFDPEASKDIDQLKWPGVTLLKAQMNADLLTEDLKKKRASNDSFWLIGQPDIILRKIPNGDDAGKYQVEVLGFDYYNTRTYTIESGGNEKIATWMLDSDYDGRSLFPRQVFFPMAGAKEGWSKLAKNLKAEIDDDLIESYRGTVSLLLNQEKIGKLL